MASIHLFFVPNPHFNKIPFLDPSVNLVTDLENVSEEVGKPGSSFSGPYCIEAVGDFIEIMVLSGLGHAIQIEPRQLKGRKTSSHFPIRFSISNDGVTWTATFRGREIEVAENPENEGTWDS